MNELTRMQYLEAMGIAMFVPRRVLPGAPQSKRAAIPQVLSSDLSPVQTERLLGAELGSGFNEVDTPAATPTRNASALSGRLGIVEELIGKTKSPVAKSRGESRDTDLTHLTEKDVASEVITEAQVDAAKSVVDEAPVTFSLSVWRPTQALVVLDARAAAEALPTQQLLINMLLAKHIEFSQVKPEILKWPPEGIMKGAGWTAAQSMVMAFLQGRLEWQPARYVWLMGEPAFRAVLGGQTTYESALGKVIAMPELKVEAVVLPSLTEMLRHPERKAITWGAIRSLHV